MPVTVTQPVPAFQMDDAAFERLWCAIEAKCAEAGADGRQALGSRDGPGSWAPHAGEARARVSEGHSRDDAAGGGKVSRHRPQVLPLLRQRFLDRAPVVEVAHRQIGLQLRDDRRVERRPALDRQPRPEHQVPDVFHTSLHRTLRQSCRMLPVLLKHHRFGSPTRSIRSGAPASRSW